MDEEHGEVVALFPSADDSPVLTQEGAGKERKSYCPGSHRHVELDTEARRVYCRDCGREVPAFDALHRLARDYERYRSSLRETRRQLEVAEARLEEIKRQERNAKARVRRRGDLDDQAVRRVELAAEREWFERNRGRR